MANPETEGARERTAEGDPAREASDERPHREDDKRTVVASAVLGALLLLAAAVTLLSAVSLRAASSGPLGPTAFPTLIGTLLAIVGVSMIVRALRQLPSAPGTAGVPLGTLLRLVALVALLVVFAVVLPVVGYVVSSAALFTGAALLLGSPHPWRAPAYGWSLAVVVFLVFDGMIGLSLPTGPWGF